MWKWVQNGKICGHNITKMFCTQMDKGTQLESRVWVLYKILFGFFLKVLLLLQHSNEFRRGSRILVRRGPAEFGPQGGPWAQHLLKTGVFPLKLSENCVILKKSWGQGGPGSPGPPGSATGILFHESRHRDPCTFKARPHRVRLRSRFRITIVLHLIISFVVATPRVRWRKRGHGLFWEMQKEMRTGTRHRDALGVAGPLFHLYEKENIRVSFSKHSTLNLADWVLRTQLTCHTPFVDTPKTLDLATTCLSSHDC